MPIPREIHRYECRAGAPAAYRRSAMTLRHVDPRDLPRGFVRATAGRRLRRRSVAPVPARGRRTAPASVGEGRDEAVADAQDRGDEARTKVVVLELEPQGPDVAVHDRSEERRVGK